MVVEGGDGWLRREFRIGGFGYGNWGLDGLVFLLDLFVGYWLIYREEVKVLLRHLPSLLEDENRYRSGDIDHLPICDVIVLEQPLLGDFDTCEAEQPSQHILIALQSKSFTLGFTHDQLSLDDIGLEVVVCKRNLNVAAMRVSPIPRGINSSQSIPLSQWGPIPRLKTNNMHFDAPNDPTPSATSNDFLNLHTSVQVHDDVDTCDDNLGSNEYNDYVGVSIFSSICILRSSLEHGTITYQSILISPRAHGSDATAELTRSL